MYNSRESKIVMVKVVPLHIRDLHRVPETKKTRPDSNPKSGRVRVGFRVSTFLFGSGSGLKTNFFSEKY